MHGDFIVMIKSGNLRKSIENFGGNRYLCRVAGQTEEEINAEILEMLSKYTGIPAHRFVSKAKMGNDTKIFQLV